MARLVTLKEIAKVLRRCENDNVKEVTEEIQHALLLVVHSPIDDWVLDSKASFYTSLPQEIVQNYIANDVRKVYLPERETLDIVRLGDMNVVLPNRNFWTL